MESGGRVYFYTSSSEWSQCYIYVCTGCGSFLGGYVLCIRISTDDIKGFLTQMIDPLAALCTPCCGPKTKTFCYIICNSWLTLWHPTLRKYQVKEGTGWQWRLLLQDGGQRSWLLVWVVPKCQNVDLLPYYWTKTSFWSFSDCGRALRLQVLCSSSSSILIV